MELNIGEKLYEYRKGSNLSQEELADKIGVSRQAVSKWERGEAYPEINNVMLLAKLYGVTVDELLCDNYSQSAPKTGGVENSAGKPTVHFTDEKSHVWINTDGIFADGEANSKRFTRGKDDDDEEESFWSIFPYPVLVTIVYLIIGFWFNLWHPGWILYLTIPFYYPIKSYFFRKRRRANS